MSFNLSKELIEAHESLRLGKQTLFTDYLLTFYDGTTFNIIGGKGIPNSRIESSRIDKQAILGYEKAEDVLRLQSLPENVRVMLNAQEINLKEALEFIGRDYLPRPRYQGLDDAPEIIDSLLIGRNI